MRKFFTPLSMANLQVLDQQFRLLPWIDPVHKEFVSGQYGSKLCDKKMAEAYLVEYEKREKLADEAYELQRTLLRQSSTKAGEIPQELPPVEKLDWNPRERFKQAIAEPVKEPVKEPAKEPVKIKRKKK